MDEETRLTFQPDIRLKESILKTIFTPANSKTGKPQTTWCNNSSIYYTCHVVSSSLGTAVLLSALSFITFHASFSLIISVRHPLYDILASQKNQQ